MVLVSVCDDEPFYLVDVVLKIGGIRDYQINAEHIILGKGKSAVHYNNTVSVLEGSYIHSDLLKSSQGDDLEAVGFLLFTHIFLQIVSSESSELLLLLFALFSFYRFLYCLLY